MTLANPIDFDQPDAPASGPARPVARTAWGQLVSRPRTVFCLSIIGLYVLAGVASFLPILDRATVATVGGIYDPPHLGPHPAAWLGTDILGRSVLWRMVYGTRVALIITVGTSVLSLGIGTALGVLAGYFGGWVDAIITWLFTTISSIPWILLVVGIMFALQGYEFASGQSFKERFGDLPAIILALGITDWVGLCRLLRGEVFKHREADYVTAARAAGAGTPRILVRHILPNVMHLVIITFSLSAVGYVQAEVALTFIGIGVSEKPSWGRMITDSKLEILRGVWWEAVAASAAIFAISWALNIVGDALRDALDPKLRGRD
jgi:ABC-type dipeptide/oligopeptide/nickel transport system permease subunit